MGERWGVNMLVYVLGNGRVNVSSLLLQPIIIMKSSGSFLMYGDVVLLACICIFLSLVAVFSVHNLCKT